MVAVAARHEVEQTMAEAPRRRRRRRWALGGGLLAAAALGFLAIGLMWPDRNREFLEDLPVLENLDEYRQIDDVAFLDMLVKLDRAGVLPKDIGETPKVEAMPWNRAINERRQYVEGLSAGRKEELQRLKERFDALDGDQQQQLRTLDDTLQKSPDAQYLRQVMRRYYEWFKTLASYTRAELAEMEPANRIKSVEERLKKDQARDVSRRLGAEDMKNLQKWTKDYAALHEKEFRATLHDQQLKERLAKLSPTKGYQLMFFGMLRQAAGAERPQGLLTEADLAKLRAALSPEAGQYLQTLPPDRQWRQVAEWMRHAARQRQAHGAIARPNDEALANFFEHDLSDEERDRLLSLPGEEMQRELQRLYWNLTRPGPRGGSPHGPRSGGGRPMPESH
jgi:hypothetical protein